MNAHIEIVEARVKSKSEKFWSECHLWHTLRNLREAPRSIMIEELKNIIGHTVETQ